MGILPVVSLTSQTVAQEKSKASQDNPPAVKKMNVTIGPQWFDQGDKITIDEVRSALGTLDKGDTVVVKGTYTLASHPKATLAFYVTQDSKDPQGPDPKMPPTMAVDAGTGSFEIERPITCKGHLHVSFYPIPPGESFSSVYFGTEAQMKEIAHWNKDSVIHTTDPKAITRQGDSEAMPVTLSGGIAIKKDSGPPTASTDPSNANSTVKKPKPKITLESLGFFTSVASDGAPENFEEIETLIKQKKYKLLKTFNSPNGEKQYIYRFTFPDGQPLNMNFTMPLDGISSWADYEKKQLAQREQRNERIAQALTAGRFRLLNLEVMQIHLCRDVDSGEKFKVQRIERPGGKDIALFRVDYNFIPSLMKRMSWKQHLQAIRDGKRELLELETANHYTYEMTADDGTKVTFSYGGTEPLEAMVDKPKKSEPIRKSNKKPNRKTTIKSTPKARSYSYSRYSGTRGEQVVGSRPKGNCSIGGTVVDEDGKPVKRARMYLHYNVTHGSIFVNTDDKGRFEIKDIPTGPFSLSMSHTRGYQDTPYSPDGKTGLYPPFSLDEGENRSDIVIKVKKAYRISGRIVGENGKRPKNFGSYMVLAWVECGGGYRTQHAMVNHRSGTYTIDGLDGKPVYVMAINWTAARKGEAWPAIYYPSAFSRTEAKQVVFDESKEVDDVDITLREKGGIVLEGTVRDSQGNPVPEAFVVAHHRDMSFDYNTAYTDEKGHYRIEGLGPGSLQVHVDAAQRGFVRTRAPLELDEDIKEKKLDFTLNPGVTISGKLVDEQGNDWHIGTSYAYAWNVDEDRPARTQRQLNEGDFSLTNFQNKHRPKNVDRRHPGTFLKGEGDYDCDQAIFTTTNTLLIQGVMPGHTMIGLSPQKERQKAVKILYQGKDILESGIETTPGQVLDDVTIVVGKE